MPTDAYIGLGSNLNNPEQQVFSALEEINRIKNTQLIASSSLYESAPLGPADQPDYINAVARIETNLSPNELLLELQTLENRHGRKRSATKWQARSLDLDLLVYGDSVINENTLTVPHPEIRHRNFVLYPLHEVCANLSIPGLGLVSQLRAKCDKKGLLKLSKQSKER